MATYRKRARKYVMPDGDDGWVIEEVGGHVVAVLDTEYLADLVLAGLARSGAAKPCRWCKGTGTAPEPTAVQKEKAAQKLIQLALAADTLHDKTDAEIAQFLADHVYPTLNVLSVTTDSVHQAIERLKRAGGGPLPRPDEEEDETDA